MCGIAGWAGHAPAEPGRLQAAMDSMAYRGPDARGVWASDCGRAGLSHVRLSIRDLSDSGAQPMSDAAGNTIVFNGEIYNCDVLRDELRGHGHGFAGTSDTEVLLAAYRQWGRSCLDRLTGMFAFVIHDAARAQLFMARDRCGEKPFYFALRADGMCFASELKALMQLAPAARRLDPTALTSYLMFGYAGRAQAMLAECRKLPAGHAATFDLQSCAFDAWCYWRLPLRQTEAASETDLLEQGEALLGEAVSRQLAADVPVGVLLSGGIDSSLVTALAARAAGTLNTYTVTFSDGRSQEAENARLLVAHFGTDHKELEVDLESFDRIESIIENLDEPLADSSLVPTFLVSELVRRQCTVALGGDGGDELFGGYNHYMRMTRLQRAMTLMPRPLLRSLSKAARAVLPAGIKGRNYLTAFDAPSGPTPFPNVFFDPAALSGLLKPQVHEVVRTASAALQDDGGVDYLDAATRLDFVNYLPEDILAKVDRASMLHSLEMRAPFLDHALVEFAFGNVPSKLKADHAEGKKLLRTLAAKLLPAGFDMSKKQGFEAPVGHWLRQKPFRALAERVLLDDGSLLRPEAVQQLLAGIDRGSNHGERIFGLLVLEVWRRRNKVTT